MDVEIRQVEQFDEALLKTLMDRNLGPSISTRSIRRTTAPVYAQQAETIRFGAFDGDRLVGLSHGQAESASRFHMHVSLVEQDYRGRGIYSAMLERMLEATRGYDEVESNHHVFNNPIITLKLRRGFHIIGFDQSILVGPRVTLRYYHNEALLQLMKDRVGWAR